MTQPLAWGLYFIPEHEAPGLLVNRRNLDAQIRTVRVAMVRQANQLGYTLAELFVGWNHISRPDARNGLTGHLTAFADVTEAIFVYGDVEPTWIEAVATETIRLGDVGDYVRFRVFRLQHEGRSQWSAQEPSSPRT